MTYLRKAWTWVKAHTWAMWIFLGAMLVVIIRVVFYAMKPVDALNAERSRLEWERQALEAETHRAQMDLRRAELLRQAAEKARERRALEGETIQVVTETAAELERIQDMDADQLAEEWERLRRSEEETPALGFRRK